VLRAIDLNARFRKVSAMFRASATETTKRFFVMANIVELGA
jgi:hypothetical protein